ncbi:MAG TPA: hypothetical protein VF981_03370 [Gemmatimonadaceae bacterium]
MAEEPRAVGWRSERAHSKQPRWFPGEDRLGDAWLQLQYAHTAVRPVDPAVRADLLDKYLELERTCLARPDLADYYRETFVADATPESVPHLPAEAVEDAVWHLATMQVCLAEYVYKVLQLGRFANAPPNRSWMMLFRRWGRSPRFDAVTLQVSPTLREDFTAFYQWYLRGGGPAIERDPVPHPWDASQRRLDKRALGDIDRESPEQQSWRSVDAMVEYLPGSFLDSGFQELQPGRVAAQVSPAAPRPRGVGASEPAAPAFDDEGYLRPFTRGTSAESPDQDEPPPTPSR